MPQEVERKPETEPSILEYARFYGLARNYKTCEPLDCLSPLGEQSYQAALEWKGDGVADHTMPGGSQVPCSCLTDFIDGRIGNPQCGSCINGMSNASDAEVVGERLFIDAATASLLSCVYPLASSSPRFDEDIGLDAKRNRRLKHALPLLCSDHECDLQALFQPFLPDLQNEYVPCETLDEEADQGFTWPSAYIKLQAEAWKKATAEKLDIPALAFQYLSEVVRYDISDTSKAIFDLGNEDGLCHKAHPLPKPASPPLLQMSPEIMPFVPSSDAGHLDLLSDYSSPTKEELRKVELQVFAKDAIILMTKALESGSQSSDPMLLDSDSVGDIYSPLKCIRASSSSPPEHKLRSQNYKVDVPLFTAHTETSVPWRRKSVSFNERVTEIIPNLQQLTAEADGNDRLDEIDAFFDETIKPIALEAERSTEQEKLQEADTIGRVDVPVMDFSCPVAPWEIARRRCASSDAPENHNILREVMKAIQLKDCIWFLDGKVERELQWTPFPMALGKVELQETIPDQGIIAAFLTHPACLDTNALTWKPRNLRIFTGIWESSKEELEQGSLDEGKDFESLIRKRKLDLQDKEISTSRLEPSETLTTIQRDRSSALKSLEDYIHTRKGTLRAKEKALDRHPVCQPKTQKQLINRDCFRRQDNGTGVCEAFLLPVLPSLHMLMSRDQRAFIVSASFLRDRKFARQIQRIFPAADFIERDFSSHDSSLNKTLSSKSSQPTMLPDIVESEADITISASTGLLWTTLQKLRQLPLPGQTTRSCIRERIRRAAPRYERLIVLISEGRQDHNLDRDSSCGGLDSIDCEAIAQFTAFCSSLEDETVAIFASGGTEELTRWIVAIMAQHSVSEPSNSMIQDETAWEVFLRRAGFNAFAAQTITGNPSPRNMEKDGDVDFGLTAFVKMSERERFARFEEMFGGRGLLYRVSKLIETRW